MNKSEYISLVRASLSGGNPVTDTKGKYHPLRIEKYIGEVFTTFVRLAFNEADITKDYSVLDWYVKQYRNVPVTYDSALQSYYAIAPSTVMPLPKLAAYRLICPMQDQTFAFAPESSSSEAVFAELEVSSIIPVPSFYVEHNKIWFTGKMSSDYNPVLIKAVTRFEDFEDTDEIYLPGGQDTNFFKEVQKLVEQQSVTQEDLQNNNNGR